MNTIPFSKVFLTGKEQEYISNILEMGTLSGDHYYTKKVSSLLEDVFKIKKILLTTSCSSALDMTALLLNLDSNCEIIMPSFTFVSTANAVMLRKAKPVFVDIDMETLNIDLVEIEKKITKKTTAVYAVHYAGSSCDMDSLLELAKINNIKIVEDAAQAVNSFYKNKPLGTLGNLGCYSFHNTKNYICGEGGAILLNDDEYINRAEIIREKGTNRSEFFKGLVDKYTWVDVGSSFLLSDILAAFLYAQLEYMTEINDKREYIYNRYFKGLEGLECQERLRRPVIPDFNKSNYHMFYIILNSEEKRDYLMAELKKRNILAVFHYIPLHTSPMGKMLGYKEGDFPITEAVSKRLLRLPFYVEMDDDQIDYIIEAIKEILSGG